MADNDRRRLGSAARGGHARSQRAAARAAGMHKRDEACVCVVQPATHTLSRVAGRKKQVFVFGQMRAHTVFVFAFCAPAGAHAHTPAAHVLARH